MASVDEKVVKLSMDESELDKGTKKAINDLDDLKKALEFKDAERGLEAVTKAAAQVDMSPLSTGIGNVTNQFNLLNTVATSAIFNVTNKAIDAGERLIKSLSVDQINAGWDKFADKTSAVQTIMASTSNQFSDTGKQMEYVETELDKLNWFTDETSYRFLDMVNNIGKFTASNIALDKSVDAMQGIATWAARSGAGVQGASRAMYNLSQSMAMGAVRLQDWMSIENANMATYEFKETALDTAVELGALKKVADGLYSTFEGTTITVEGFRESLQKNWMTSDVLIKTLEKYGGFATELNKFYEELGAEVPTTTLLGFIDDFVDGSLDMQHAMTATGMSAEELSGWLEKLGSEQYKLGRESFKAAQETKTFQEAIDYVKESVSSGWMRTFEYLFGNYEEAKEFFSNMSEWLYDIFVASGDARNGLLMLWKDEGGRDQFIEGLYQVMENISTLMETIRDSWQEVFPPATVDDLHNLTDGFRRLIDILTPTEEVLQTISNLVRMLATSLQTLKRVVSSVARGLEPYLRTLNRLAGIAMNVVGLIADFSVRLMNLIFPTEKVDAFGNSLRSASDIVNGVLNIGLDGLVDVLASVFHAVDTFFNYVEENGLTVANIFTGIYLAFQDLIDNLFNMESIESMVGGMFEGIKVLFGGLFEAVQDFIESVSGLDLSSSGGVEGWLEGVSESLEATDISGKLSAIVVAIGNVAGALLQFAGDLLGVDTDIRGVINDLVRDIVTVWDWLVDQLSKITLEDVKNVALVVFLGELVFSIKSLLLGLKSGVSELTKTVKLFRGLLDNLGDESITSRMESIFSKTKWLQIALAIGILVSGLLQLSRIPKDELYQGVLALVAVLGMVMVAMKMIEKMNKSSSKGKDTTEGFIKTMSAMGIAIGLISMGVSQIAKAGDPTQIMASVLALGGIMTELWILMKGLEQVDTSKLTAITTSLLPLSLAIKVLSSAASTLGGMDPKVLIQGIAAVGGLMVAIGLFGKLMQGADWKAILAVTPMIATMSAALLALDLVLASMMGMVLVNQEAFETASANLMGLIAIFGIMNTLLASTASAGKASSLAALALELIAFSAAIGVIAGAIEKLGTLPADQLREGVNTIGGAIAGLTVSLTALLVVAQLCQGAAAPLALLAATILSIAAAFAAFGLAAAGIAIVISAISGAFKMLIEVGAEFGEELPNYINNAMNGVAVAIDRLLGIIIQARSKMVLAAVSFFGAILEGLTTLIPDIIGGFMVLWTEIFNTIAALGPPLIKALTDMLAGITDNLGPLFNELDRLLEAIFAHLAISIHRLITDVGGFIYGIITGEDFRDQLTNAVSKSTKAALEEGSEKGKEAAKEHAKKVFGEAAVENTTEYSDSAQKTVDETMPAVGESAVSEFADSANDNADLAADAGVNIASVFGDNVVKTLESYHDQIDSSGLFNFGLSTVSNSSKDDGPYVSPRLQKTLERRKKWEEDQKKSAGDLGYDIGDSIGEGVGSGLASSTAPSSAARSQAQTIGDAFSDEIKKLNLNDKTGDALFRLWKAQNPNASEADIAIKEMELQAQKIETQAARAQISQQKYTDTLEKMGESASETHEAYNEMLEDQIKLLELQNEMATAQTQGHEATAEAFQKMNDIMHDYYYTKNNGRTTAEFLKSLGFTDLEIAEAAAKEAGYAIPKIVEDTKDKTVEATQSVGEKTVELYAQSVTTNLESLTPKFQGFGNTYADSLGNGMVEKTADVGNAAVQTINEAREEAGSQNMIEKWKDLGVNLMKGVVQGIVIGSPEVQAAIAEAVRAAIRAAKAAAGVASPSKETMWQASMWMEGYVQGINKNAKKVRTSLTDVVTNALKVASNKFDGGIVGEGTVKTFISGMNMTIDQLNQKAQNLVKTTTEDIDKMLEAPKDEAYYDLVNRLFYHGKPDMNMIRWGIDLSLSDRSKRLLNSISGMNGIVGPIYDGTEPLDSAQALRQQQIKSILTRQIKEQKGTSSEQKASTVQNINMTQNNYSPKSLSRMDIRRDTQNMVTAVANKIRSR